MPSTIEPTGRCAACDYRPFTGTCPFCGRAFCDGCGRFHKCEDYRA